MSLAPSPLPPKSCLKRNSFSEPTTRPLFLDGAAPITRARAATVSTSPVPVFDSDSDTASDHSAFPPPSAHPYYGANPPRARRKSVSFCEEDDVRVFYPVTDPLCKQARKQVVRIFSESLPLRRREDIEV